MAISFPTAPMDGDTYDYEGTTYRYDNENGNNRWIAEAAGGGSITVSQTRPDPMTGMPGDLWWYCGDTGEDPGLFTLIADVTTDPMNPQQQWVQSSPGIAFEGGSGRVAFGESPPTSSVMGDLFYRTIGSSARSQEALYVNLDGERFRRIAVASLVDDLIPSGVSTFPAITGFPASPTMSFTTANATGTIDISSLADDQWVVAYIVGGGGGGAIGTSGGMIITTASGGSGAASIAAYPKLLLGDTLTYTVGSGGADGRGGTAFGISGGTSTIMSDDLGQWTAPGGTGGFAQGLGTPSSTPGTNGTGNFTWPDNDGLLVDVQGTGTSAGITDITGSLNGGGGVWGGNEAGTSTYAGNAGSGGSAGVDGRAGFVRIWFPR